MKNKIRKYNNFKMYSLKDLQLYSRTVLNKYSQYIRKCPPKIFNAARVRNFYIDLEWIFKQR